MPCTIFSAKKLPKPAKMKILAVRKKTSLSPAQTNRHGPYQHKNISSLSG